MYNNETQILRIRLLQIRAIYSTTGKSSLGSIIFEGFLLQLNCGQNLAIVLQLMTKVKFAVIISPTKK